MAHANVEHPARGENAAHRIGLQQVNRLLRAGGSWSGRERNCCFLNLAGTGQFADISGLSGFDFDDDARALGLVDWNADGALDVWVTNRSAPSVRLLLGAGDPSHHYLRLRLVGQTCNRDAIGARVEIFERADSQVAVCRRLRAGEGFLGQSSKWLHFGLGAHETIHRVVVHWPHGQPETFRNLDVDRHYRLVQDSGHAELAPLPAPTISDQPAFVPLASEQARRILLVGRLPIPAASYLDPQGAPKRLTSSDSPRLVMLWAGWCRPCLAELKQLAEQQQRLEQLGLDLLALNVEGIGGDVAAAKQSIRSQQDVNLLPFGTATAPLLGGLEVLQASVLNQDRPLSLPTSFLLDDDGRVAAIYHGTIDLEQLEADLKLLDAPLDQLQLAAAPLQGRWCTDPVPLDPLAIAQTFVDREALQEAADYLEQLLRDDPDHYARRADVFLFLGSIWARLEDWKKATLAWQQAVEIDPQHTAAHLRLGHQFLKQARFDPAADHFSAVLRDLPTNTDAIIGLGAARRNAGAVGEAIHHYERALQIRPNWPEVKNDLAWILATCRLPALRDPDRAVQLAEQVCTHFGQQVPAPYLDTLSAALHSAGRTDDALQATHRAIDAARRANDDQLVEQLRQRLAELANVDSRTEKQSKDESDTAEIVPSEPVFADAIDYFRKLLSRRPDLSDPLIRTAWIFASHEDPRIRDAGMARQLAEMVCQSPPSKQPKHLAVLAAAQAASGKFGEAAETIAVATRYVTAADEDLLLQLRSRQQSYQNHLAVRESTGNYHVAPPTAKRRIAQAHYLLGKILVEEHADHDAVVFLQNASQLQPTWHEVRVDYARALLRVRRAQEAAAQLTAILPFDRDNAELLVLLAKVNDRIGKPARAVRGYRRALQLRPGWTEAINDLAWMLCTHPDPRIHDAEEAVRLAESICQGDQPRGEYFDTLGAAYAAAGRFADAVTAAECALEATRAIDLDEVSEAVAQRLSLYRQQTAFRRTDRADEMVAEAKRHRQQGDLSGAVKFYYRALKVRGDWSEVANDLAWLLAAHADSEIHNPHGAVHLAEQVCHATAHRRSDYLDTLAVAYAAIGQFDQAVTYGQRALDAAHANGREILADQIRQRLELFRQGQAYHAPEPALPVAPPPLSNAELHSR